jgi:hypothetical protein
MQYKLIDILKNDTKNKILYMILLVILCLFIIVQFYELTKFVYNYSYFFDYGKSLKDICLSSYAEYETSRFQVAMNLDNIKVQSDNFSKNSIYDVIILIMALCISLFSSFVLVLILLQGTNTEFISLLKEIWNGTSFIEIAYKVLKFSLMFILTLYVVFIPSIYFILKLSDTADISPFQVEAAQISLHLIAILAITFILIVWHFNYYEDGTPSLFIKLMMTLIFCLYSYVFIRITDNYSRDKHNNDLKYYDEVDSVISDYFKNIVGLSDITSTPLYTQKNTIFIIGNIIIGLIFIWLVFKYIIIYFEFHNIHPKIFKEEDKDILYYMIIPLMMILVIIFVCTANQEYNTNINKYVLYQPAKIYKQNVANINKIFNQILENDQSSIENKSVCRNYANAIHLTIYSTIFDQVNAQNQATGINDDTILKEEFTKESVKKLFIPKFAYNRTCDDSEYTNYNDIPEYNVDYYINDRINIFFDDNKQCNTISNKMLIAVMINSIPNNRIIDVNNIDVGKFKNYLMFAITNIQKGLIYDGTKDLEYSNNYENNNNIASFKDVSNNSIADKHLNTVINSISEIYKTYLLTMYTQTLTTINAICKCNGVEDIADGTTDYGSITKKIIREVTYNTNAYTSNLKREYITIFIKNTKEFLIKVNAIMSSEIMTNANYKLAKMIITNYNILHESSKFKHFPLYSEQNQTNTANLTKDYFKDIEKIQEIIDKIHTSVLSKQSYDTVLYDKLVAEYQRYINIFAIVNTQSSDYFEQLLFSYKKKYIEEYIKLYKTLNISNENGIAVYTTNFDEIKYEYIDKYTKVWKLSKNIFKNELTLSNTDYRTDSIEANTRANDASLSSYILIVIYLIGIALSYIIA